MNNNIKFIKPLLPQNKTMINQTQEILIFEHCDFVDKWCTYTHISNRWRSKEWLRGFTLSFIIILNVGSKLKRGGWGLIQWKSFCPIFQCQWYIYVYLYKRNLLVSTYIYCMMIDLTFGASVCWYMYWSMIGKCIINLNLIEFKMVCSF